MSAMTTTDEVYPRSWRRFALGLTRHYKWVLLAKLGHDPHEIHNRPFREMWRLYHGILAPKR